MKSPGMGTSELQSRRALLNTAGHLRGFGPGASVLPDALTPAADRPIIAQRAGERAVSNSYGGIGPAIAHGLTTRINPTEIFRCQDGAAD
jgi:hypothetical protein